MKDDLPYFSHDNDSRNHAKMKALRARFGWSGYGQFWALNEMIAGSSNAMLDLSRKVVRAGAACELGMTTDELDAFLDFLADKDECGLIRYENGIITTDRTQEDYAVVCSNRTRKQVQYKNGKKKGDFGAPKDDFSKESPCRIDTERENREKRKKESRKDKETPSPENPAQGFSVSQNGSVKSSSGSERIEAARRLWNEKGCIPPCQRTVLNFSPDVLSECLRTINSFSDDAIAEAIQNYSTITSSSEHEVGMPYGSFHGFLKGGVDKFTSASNPFERFKKQAVSQGHKKQLVTDLSDVPDTF